MRKVLPVVILLLIIAQYGAQAQRTIKVEQYTVLIQRTVNRTYLGCQAWRTEGVAVDPIDCLRDEFTSCQNNKSLWENMCLVWDDNCTYAVNDQVSLNWYITNGNVSSSTSFQAKPINWIPKSGSAVYYDTIHVFQPISNGNARVETVLKEGYAMDPTEYEYNCNWSPDMQTATSSNSINPTGDLFDQTFQTFSNHYRYVVDTRVRVIPNMDVSYTLPSHDKVEMSAPIIFGIPTRRPRLWQYKDIITNQWHDIPSSFYDGTSLKISGYDLFGDNYVNYLNSTINFQAIYSDGVATEMVPFTLRLSSPHISSVSKTDLNCFERNEGSIKIQFDRQLLPGEKLNILLLDTIHQVNYSAFNLSSLAGDNSYTWPNELRSGTYQVNLIGKYAKGIEYDLTVNTRNTDPEYKALNSVNFEDGFNTPETDDFNAYTDYTGFSQATYTGAINHIAFQTLTQPEKIRFVARVDNNVLCKGSASGVITLAAAGGKGNYKYSIKRDNEANYSSWVNFSNTTAGNVYIANPYFNSNAGITNQVNNLKAGNYTVRIRDGVDCYAKDSAGNEITYSFTITEPAKGITLDLYELSPITSPTAANAQVKVQISGGTPNVSTPEVTKDPYTVTFTDSATGQQIALTNTILEANKRMQSVTALLDAGTYYLRIYDAYYPGQTDPGGCYFEMKIPIRRPDPLLVDIASKKSISCFDSTNGKLVAKASGGIPIDSIGYTFKWYKVTNEGNSLLTDTDSLLEDVAAGNYQVEVTDKYNNKTTSQTFTLTQPAQMQLSFTATQASCYASRDGSLHVSVTGGTPFGNGSYTYQWSNGDRTATADTLMGGNYMVVVTDSMFCMARDTFSVTSPVRIMANAVTTPVSCRSQCDGQIALQPSGGQGVYTYAWNTGANTATISNLCPGTYWYTVSDVGGCFDSDTIVISNPDTLYVNLGIDRKLCIGQTIRLDATASDTALLTYNWQGNNGFTANTAKVALTQAGTYQVAVSNRGGCVVKDTIVLTAQNSNINTDYVVSTQAFVNENVTLVNISQPRTDSVKWLLPSIGNSIRPVTQTNDKCELIFSDTGRYAITMEAYYASGCIDDTTKTVNVITRGGSVTSGSQSNAYLQAYAVIYPNPNDGHFRVDLTFSEVTRARMRLINSLTNVTVDDRLVQGLAEYHEDYNVTGFMSGVYILVIDAAKGCFVYKVIIAH